MTFRTIFTGLLLFSLASCKTAYKSGQTPDDIYMAESLPGGEAFFMSGNDNASEADPGFRMRCRTPRWRHLLRGDAYDYWYSPYDCYSFYGSGFNAFPFPYNYPATIFYTPSRNKTPRTGSLSAYGQGPLQTTTNIKTGETKVFSRRESNDNKKNSSIIRSQPIQSSGGRTYSPSGSPSRPASSGRIFSGRMGN